MEEQRIEKLWGLIDKYIKENKLSLRQFGKKCGLNPGYLVIIKQGKHPNSKKSIEIGVKSLERIAVGMDMTLEDLMRKCGYFD